MKKLSMYFLVFLFVLSFSTLSYSLTFSPTVIDTTLSGLSDIDTDGEYLREYNVPIYIAEDFPAYRHVYEMNSPYPIDEIFISTTEEQALFTEIYEPYFYAQPTNWDLNIFQLIDAYVEENNGTYTAYLTFSSTNLFSRIPFERRIIINDITEDQYNYITENFDSALEESYYYNLVRTNEETDPYHAEFAFISSNNFLFSSYLAISNGSAIVGQPSHVNPVPEPKTFVLFLTALIPLFFIKRFSFNH